MTAQQIQSAFQEAEALRLRAVNIEEVLSMDIPPRNYLLEPILQEQGLAMVYAKRGVGKTHFALGAAYAVASGGSFLKWKAEIHRPVLYIDGEMPAEAMKKRLAQISELSEGEPPDPNFFRLITPDLQTGAMPDISTLEGQADIEPFLKDVALVVVDNLSTLTRTGKENEAEGWLSVQEWALRLRRRGISVLFVHHSGKGGQQRGTSRREDVLDTVIRLDHPADYNPADGARFEVHIDKGRGIFGDDANSFEAKLSGDHWSWRDLEDVRYLRVIELSREKMTVRDIAEETGISKSTVNRMQKRAKANGDI